MYHETYDIQRCAYSGHCARRLKCNREDCDQDDLFPCVQRFPTEPQFKPFPSFGSRGINGYNGFVPSRQYLRNVFVAAVQGDSHIFDNLMALNANGDVMSADDSFKVTKRMYKVRKVKMCAGLFTVMNNRTGTVILQVIHGVSVLQYRRVWIVGFVQVEGSGLQLQTFFLSCHLMHVV